MKIQLSLLIIPIIAAYGNYYNINCIAWETLEGCQLISSSPFDGDRVLVQHEGKEIPFRIYWVDAPNCPSLPDQHTREQSHYFSISESQVIESGKEAKRFTENFLRGKFTVHTGWEDARTDGSPCYYAILEKEGQPLSMELTRNGLARIYGVPTQNPWPNGYNTEQYLTLLKNQERKAQKNGSGIWARATASLQVTGLEKLSAGGGEVLMPLDPSEQLASETININTATLAELQTLPGIGPALSQRIIEARPIASIDELVQISGISTNILAGFRDLIVTEDPPPPVKTAAYFRANPDQYLEQEVLVVVQKVETLNMESPDGFRALKLHTAFKGRYGGTITAYIPEEFFDSFKRHYASPGKEFTGWLHARDGDIVLIYRRK